MSTYGYDDRDDLASKSTPVGNVSWSYDVAGNLTRHGGDGLSVSYTYDALNRLHTVDTSFAQTVTYNYDDVGNLAGTQVGALFSTGYTYDPLNRLTNMQSTCGGAAPGCGPANTSVRSYAYTLGAAGNRLSVAELSGRTVNYGYDDLYRLTSETVAGAATGKNGSVSYAFDSVGSRTQITSTLPAIASSRLLNYDANDRTATDPYDANGNLLNSGAGANVYDFENRLVQAGGVKIVYDGDGNRVQETVAGVTTEYLVGEINPTGYAQVFAELSSTNGLLRGYEWGLQLIAQRDFSAGTFVGRISYYGLDGHGSVRYLTDPNGAITDAYDYDAFGNLIAQTGTTFNNYLFAGEQFDPALGVYYNRARYYDHRQGRFWTRDPAFGRVTRPDSFHPYSYASLNPINRKDPTGLVTIAEEDVAIAENQTVQAIPLPSVAQEVIAIARPEVIAEAPQVFGLLAKTIAWLSIGTIAFGTYFGATSGGGGVPTDQAVAEANSNNYDIYRFGNAQGPAKLRAGYDYYLNSGGLIDPQNPMSSTFAGASAYRDPFHNDVKQLGLNGVLWRVGLQNVLIADGLSVIADGKDVKPDSTLPTGHHTIFPTIQMTSDDFEQRIRSLPWERSGRVK